MFNEQIFGNRFYCSLKQRYKQVPMKEYEGNQQQPQTYKLSRYRYVNLIIFTLAALVNSLPAQTFSSINSQVQDVFDISRVVVTLNTLLFPVLHPVFAFPSSWILDNYGIKIGCSLGGILVVAGVWMRTLLTHGSPALCLIGSTLAATGNIFILGSPSVFAINWFSSTSAPKVISLTVLLNLLSSGFGAAAGGIFVKSKPTQQEIVHFLKMQAILVTIPYILFMIFYKQMPSTPPSHSAALKIKNSNRTNEAKVPYSQTIKNLIKNKAYVKICIAMSFSFGSLISFFSIVNQCLTIVGFENPGGYSSIIVMGAIAFGLFSVAMFSYAIRQTHQYRYIISLCLLGAFTNFLFLQFAIIFKISSFLPVFFIAGCAGFFLVPLTALFASYASEAGFPEGQGSITGYLFAVSQTFGFILGIICISWMDKQSPWKITVILLVHSIFYLAAFGVNYFTPEHLNKTKFQQNPMNKQGHQSLIVPISQSQQPIGNPDIST